MHSTWAAGQPGMGNAEWFLVSLALCLNSRASQVWLPKFVDASTGKIPNGFGVSHASWTPMTTHLLHVSHLKKAEAQLKALRPTLASTAPSGNFLLQVSRLPSSTSFNSFLAKNPKSIRVSSFWLSVTYHHMGVSGFPNNFWSQWGGFRFAGRSPKLNLMSTSISSFNLYAFQTHLYDTRSQILFFLHVDTTYVKL